MRVYTLCVTVTCSPTYAFVLLTEVFTNKFSVEETAPRELCDCWFADGFTTSMVMELDCRVALPTVIVAGSIVNFPSFFGARK